MTSSPLWVARAQREEDLRGGFQTRGTQKRGTGPWRSPFESLWDMACGKEPTNDVCPAYETLAAGATDAAAERARPHGAKVHASERRRTPGGAPGTQGSAHARPRERKNPPARDRWGSAISPGRAGLCTVANPWRRGLRVPSSGTRGNGCGSSQRPLSSRWRRYCREARRPTGRGAWRLTHGARGGSPACPRVASQGFCGT